MWLSNLSANPTGLISSPSWITALSIPLKHYLWSFGDLTWQALWTQYKILKDFLRFVNKLINTVIDVPDIGNLWTHSHRHVLATWQRMAKWLLNTQYACWNQGSAALIQLFLSSVLLCSGITPVREAWKNKKTWIKCSGSFGISLHALCSSFTPFSSPLAFSCLVFLGLCVYLYVCVRAS